MIPPLTTTPPGYEWDCPNCGEHITSWTKPPDLSQPPPPAEALRLLKYIVDLTVDSRDRFGMKNMVAKGRGPDFGAAIDDARRYLAATEEETDAT